MNKETLKAINEKSKEPSKIKKWWKKNKYKVLEIIFSPIRAIYFLSQKISNWLDSRVEWNEERAIKILDYYVVNYSKWNEKDKTFDFFDTGIGWTYKKNIKVFVKRKDRRFWKLHYRKIKEVLVNKYELEGFSKEVCDYDYSTVSILFTMQEE